MDKCITAECGGYALTHSLYDYDDGHPGVAFIRVDSFSLIITTTRRRKEVPIATRSQS
jgi:hypothetical protein